MFNSFFGSRFDSLLHTTNFVMVCVLQIVLTCLQKLARCFNQRLGFLYWIQTKTTAAWRSVIPVYSVLIRWLVEVISCDLWVVYNQRHTARALIVGCMFVYWWSARQISSEMNKKQLIWKERSRYVSVYINILVLWLTWTGFRYFSPFTRYRICIRVTSV